MTDALDVIRSRGRGVAAMRVALALSLLIHLAVLWRWVPQVRYPSTEMPQRDDSTSALSVQLTPRPSRPPALQPAPLPRAERPFKVEMPPSKPARPPKAPPVIALNRPAPDISSSSPARAPISPPSAARLPADGDLASYVESRRQARGDPAPSVDSVPTKSPIEDENARANRLAAANLGSDRKPVFGPERRGGGVFHIQHLGYDYAEFLFFGWNKDIRRNTQQLVEVRKGGHANIRIAVVRRMIAIIREHEQGDFVWESQRLGRNVTLSARARDNAGLEEFMMREFF